MASADGRALTRGRSIDPRRARCVESFVNQTGTREITSLNVRARFLPRWHDLCERVLGWQLDSGPDLERLHAIGDALVGYGGAGTARSSRSDCAIGDPRARGRRDGYVGGAEPCSAPPLPPSAAGTARPMQVVCVIFNGARGCAKGGRAPADPRRDATPREFPARDVGIPGRLALMVLPRRDERHGPIRGIDPARPPWALGSRETLGSAPVGRTSSGRRSAERARGRRRSRSARLGANAVAEAAPESSVARRMPISSTRACDRGRELPRQGAVVPRVPSSGARPGRLRSADAALVEPRLETVCVSAIESSPSRVSLSPEPRLPNEPPCRSRP
jgi:hypothetical protein